MKATTKHMLSIALCFLMLLSILPLNALAENTSSTSGANVQSTESSNYFRVISKKSYAVAPGATETNYVLNDSTGQNQNKAYVLEVDMSNSDITVMPSYKDMDPTNYGTQIMSKQAEAAVKKGYNVVGAINVNLSWDTVEPLGMLVINGTVYHEDTTQGGGYLVVYKDNTAELRPASQPLDGSEWQAITANFGWLVKDGKSVYSEHTHTGSSRAPRTCIGVKADGSIVLLVVDGRQDPVSVGMSGSELAETLLSLGCVNAVNCDGGGSSTFITQREGGDLTIKNVPSDGTERATLGGLLVISNAVSDGVFNHASVTTESDYYTPSSSVQFNASGVDKAGSSAALPESGLSWRLADDSMGTISDSGLFTSNGTLGDVTAELLYQGEVCGSSTISILEPDSISFFETSRSFGFDVSSDMTMLMQSEGRTVTYKGSDFTWDVKLVSANDSSVTDASQIGWIEPNTTTFTANSFLSGDLEVTAKYTRKDGTVITATATVAVGKLPSVFWDYEDGVQTVEVWEEITNEDGTTEWAIKTDDDGNIVYEEKYFDAEDYYSSLLVNDPANVTIEEQMASHFGLRSDRNAKGSTEIVDIDSGEPVRFGNKSLKINYDFTGSTGAPSVLGYGYMQNTNTAPGSPTGIGMWIYVPEGTPAYSLKSIIRSAGKAIYVTYYYTYTNENGETVSTCSLADMAGKGWIYVQDSLVGKGDGTFLMLRNYTIRIIAEGFVENPDRYAAGSIYVDNIEFIYGYDNKDTVNPSVTSVYNYNGDEEIATDGSTVFTSNTISFASTFADDDGEFATGMDLESVRAYIDGVNMYEHPGFVVTQDNLMVLPNVHLDNGLHSIRIRIRDNYGNETNETRYFYVDGTEHSDTSVSLVAADENASPYLSNTYSLVLKAENIANVSSVALNAKFNVLFGEPTVTFANDFTGSYTYSSGTGELMLTASQSGLENAESNVIALVTFNVPETLTDGAKFTYSVSSGSFETVSESDFTNSFSLPTVSVPVKAYYTLTAEASVIGYPFELKVTDENGKAIEGALIHIDGLTDEVETDADGLAQVTISKAGEITAYAYNSTDSKMLRSWNQSITVHSVAGDGTANPYFVQHNAASSSSKNITWLAGVSSNDKAVLRLYTEDPSANESAEYTEHTGNAQLVHFSAESARACSVKLSGLASGTTYYYTVGDGEAWSEVLSFTTDKDTSKTNFFIIGDTQTTNTENVKSILDSLRANSVDYDFAIQTGDAVDDSTKYIYWNALSTVFDAKTMGGVDLIHVLGNHEYYGDDNAAISKAIYNLPVYGDGSYYSVEYGDVYVAVINYSATGKYQAAFDWLVDDALYSSCTWKILVMHVPAYGTNADAINSFVHNNLPSAVQEAGIDFVFSGHDHSYARTQSMYDGLVDDDGVVYFICGSTGEKSYDVTVDPSYNFALVNDTYGAMYLSVEASSESITIFAKDVNGELIDEYTKYHSDSACPEGHHTYRFNSDNKVYCAKCGDIPSGIIPVKGKLYYTIEGVLYTGWRSALDSADIYYFNPADSAAVTGVFTVDNKEFTFNDDGVLVRGAFVEEDGGTRYYFGKNYLESKWVNLDEGTYWINGSGYVARGITPHQEYNHADYYWYNFDEETGLLIGKCSGFVTYNGETYYCDENGKVFYGAIKVEDGIIFTITMGKVVKNGTCYVDGNTVGCELERGSYLCDENGYIVSDGFATISGKTYYFTNYVRAKGFTKIGDDYYMLNAYSGMMYKDANMWVGTNDYGVEPGMHYFDADGKMFVPDTENGVKQIVEENGKLYFTIDGVKMASQLLELDGEYYFAQSNGVLVTNTSVYIETTSLSGNGWYGFAEDGKLIKDGFINVYDDDGNASTYYYSNAARVKGFTKIGDDYYLFNSGSGLMYKDANMWVGTNDYGVEPGMHYFDAEGKMFVPNTETGVKQIVEENGKLYFTIDGVKMANQILELDGEYYFAQSNGVLITNASVYIETTLLCGNGWYGFGADGKLIKEGFVSGTDKNGNVNTYYYYCDESGSLVRAKGFTKIGDDYYMLNAYSGMMYKDSNRWVGTNDYGVEPGMHYFDAYGKMFIPDTENGVKQIVEENGKLYFTIDGVKMASQLLELDGEYYFAQSNGVLVTDATIYIETTLLCGNGWYGFGADGKLIKEGFVSGTDKNGNVNTYYYYCDESGNLVRAKGFTKIGEDYYLFNSGSGLMYKDSNRWVGTNDYSVEPGMHYFDADGKMFVPNVETGVKQIVEENGKLYFTIDGVKMANQILELDGEYYFAQSNGVLVTNASVYIETSLLCGTGWYGFGADGKLIKEGFVSGTDKNGNVNTYYYYCDESGSLVRAKGFTKIGEDYYLFNSGSGLMYKDANMWVGTNDYGVESGMHYFDAEGKMFVPDTENGERKIVEENGKLYFTIDGVKMTNQLLELDGEYYFAQSNGVLITNASVYIETTLLCGNGWYGFGADGKLIKEGFVSGTDKNGNVNTYYYYCDESGNLVRAKGFAKIGEDYYLFNTGSGLMYSDTYRWVEANDYGVEPGMHYFDVSGKMFVPDFENGVKSIVEENGVFYYTVDGIKVASQLLELDGEYYYAQSNCVLITNASVYIETTLLCGNGWYGFDGDGKLIKNGFVNGIDSSGNICTYYYYCVENIADDGITVESETIFRAKGFTKIGEDYYLFNTGSGLMYKDASKWVDANEYGIEPGMHYFDADGKMSLE